MSIEAKHAYRFGFLKSDTWETLRLTCIAMDEGKCAVCGKYNESNDAHHLFYRNQWKSTKVDDLLTLCRDCHKKVHELGADILAQALWEKYDFQFHYRKQQGTCRLCKEVVPDNKLKVIPARTNKPLMACEDCFVVFSKILNEIGKVWPAYERAKKMIGAVGVRKFRAKALKQFVLMGMDKQLDRTKFGSALIRAAWLIRTHIGQFRRENNLTNP